MIDNWLLLLVFYPSLALGVTIFVFFQIKDMSCDHGERMYELGRRHGRELAAIEVWKLSVELNNGDELEDAND